MLSTELYFGMIERIIPLYFGVLWIDFHCREKSGLIAENESLTNEEY